MNPSGGDGGGGGGGGGGRSEAERLLSVAEKLLAARDPVGSKKLAERALELNPLLAGVDHVLAVADVLLAAQRRINNQCDWYAVLQLDPASSGRDPQTVRRHYRRLALLLRPGRTALPGTDSASKLVADAWAVLSDPTKKSLFDAELDIATAHLHSGPGDPPRSSAPNPTFWTTCPNCFYLHLYDREYEGRRLLCQRCHRAFHATALAVAPPIVPGTSMYHCCWGFFPLGIPGGDPASGFQPFYPMSPWWATANQPSEPYSNANDPHAKSKSPDKRKKPNVAGPDSSTLPKKPPPSFTGRKVVAKKTVGNSFKKMATPKAYHEMEGKPMVIDVNEEPGCSGGNEMMGEDDQLGGFDIDLDAADMDATANLLNQLPSFN